MFNRPGIIVQLLVCMAVAWAGAAAAQMTDVQVSVEPGDIGLGGVVRPGGFTPMLVTMKNGSASPRRVRCRWIMPDIDGDPVINQRIITLSPQRTQKAWLYAAPPYNTKANNIEWRVEIIDDKSEKLLSTTRLNISELISPQRNTIGVTGPQALGLLRFTENLTRHEKTRFIRNLNPGRLPDRWYGLSMLQALIWTPDSPDPSAPSVSPETIKAIHEWVFRGGHLVVMLPAIGDDVWFNSPIADMLPAVQVESDNAMLITLGGKQTLVDVKFLTPKAPDVTPLFEHEGRPWAVAKPFGFGRVTLLGVDLSNRQLVRNNLPASGDLWMGVFGWRDAANPNDVRIARQNQGNYMPGSDLGGFVRSAVAMRESFSGAMLLAIMVFVVYWLAAGPVGFAVLKFKKRTHHAWLVFTGMVVFFSAVCWVGAMVVRPSQSAVSHVSILNIDARSTKIHAHSWLALFVARHGKVKLAVDPDRKEGNRSTISTAGLPDDEFASVFLDPQRYVINSGSPNQVTAPYRSTAKLFELDYAGRLNVDPDRNGVQWVLPQTNRLRVEGGFPAGQLSHGLPGTLHDVLIVYCRGEGNEPYVWGHSSWKPQQVLNLQRPTVDKMDELARKFTKDGKPDWVGYLPKRMRMNSSTVDNLLSGEPVRRSIAGNELITFSELLSFYSVLPPPKYWESGMNVAVRRYYRSVGRELDLSHRLSSHCLIIIGYMKDAPLPAPVHVDGRKIKGKGWTMVRWVYPLN